MGNRTRLNRRDVMKTSALALGGGLLMSEPLEAYPKAVNTNSSPSTLKITDMRVATWSSLAQAPALLFVSTPTRGCTALARFATAPAPLMLSFSRAASSVKIPCSSTEFSAKSSNLADRSPGRRSLCD